MTAAARTWALRALNVALEPLGLVLRTHAEERAWRGDLETIAAGYWRAALRAHRGEERAQHVADRWHREAERFHAAAKHARAEAARLRGHLRALDELIAADRTTLNGAARRVIDVALGRDHERAA
jgi:hypothetical protein